MNDVPTLDELEALFVSDPSLDLIRGHLNRFNPIRTMGMERMEIRHSAILAWLLDPQETHGLGDRFVKAFIAHALRGHGGGLLPTALDVSQADLMDAEVRREWRHIDLLIMSQGNGWIFVVENKFDSGQHSNQLKRYLDVVNSTFKDGDAYSKVRGIFLTLWDDDPEDESYASIQYTSICEILDQVVFSGRIPLAPEVETFLRHYYETLLEATGMSETQTEMEKLARQLYRDHKRVLEYIIDHGRATEFTMACEAVFGEGLHRWDTSRVGKQSFVFNHAGNETFSFLPKAWFDALGERELRWEGCEEWWAGFPLITWLQMAINSDGTSGQLRFYAEIGPLRDHQFRSELIEAIKEAAVEKGLSRIGFQRGAADEGKRYSKFLKKNAVPVEDVHNHEQIAAAIEKVLKSFLSELEAVAEILPRFQQYGQKDADA